MIAIKYFEPSVRDNGFVVEFFAGEIEYVAYGKQTGKYICIDEVWSVDCNPVVYIDDEKKELIKAIKSFQYRNKEDYPEMNW